MSTSSELLSSLSRATDYGQHIVINGDRSIYVPLSLYHIAVQYDHNVETVTFDAPRYVDNGNIDLSMMNFYINYKRSDGYEDSYIVNDLTIDEEDDTMLHFTWAITQTVTEVSGKLTFSVCVKNTDSNGVETNHWNSKLNSNMEIIPGLEPQQHVIDSNPEIINQLVDRMNDVEGDLAEVNTLLETFLEGGDTA